MLTQDFTYLQTKLVSCNFAEMLGVVCTNHQTSITACITTRVLNYNPLKPMLLDDFASQHCLFSKSNTFSGKNMITLKIRDD